MATYLALIQFYPAVGKLLSDLNGYWSGASQTTEGTTVLQQQLDEARAEMRLLTQLLARSVRGDIEYRDASTQTEPGVGLEEGVGAGEVVKGDGDAVKGDGDALWEVVTGAGEGDAGAGEVAQ